MPLSERSFVTQPSIRNMRVRFWGVQGSCPLFPEPREVDEYRRMISDDMLRRVIDDMRRKSANRGLTVEQLIGGPDTAANIALYLQHLGYSDLPVFGGETTCISIETSDNQVIMLDAGSGMRNASKHLVGDWGDRARALTVLTTHEHLDHRSGLPFCHFCYAKPPFDITVYGTRRCLNALDHNYGIFSHKLTPQMHDDDPVDYRAMAAKFKAIELRDPLESVTAAAEIRPWEVREVSQSFQIGATTITAFDVYHGVPRCVAYKICHGPMTFIFCTDHELRMGLDPTDPRQLRSIAAEKRLNEHCAQADLAYFDGQYFRDEYTGKEPIGLTAAVSRVDWGHGCIEDIIERSQNLGIKRTLIGHHDPERGWPERVELDQWLSTKHSTPACVVELAKCPMVVDL